MREHGLVARILLIYEAAAERLHEHRGVPASVLLGATEIVQDFVQGYHEQLEEDEVFPRFERRGELVDVVTTLRLQHMRGRAATQAIFEVALAGGTLTDPVGLEPPLRAFVRMYRPHAAREDTVVFPKLREWVQGHEYDELSELFERTEHERFGEHGFERMLARVAALEQELGLDQLAEFTA